MKIGYVRVSDDDQTEALQVDALTAANCDLIYGDHGVSGSMIERKGLDWVLSDLRNGDTLVVWKLDRLGRSTLHLMQLLDGLRSRGIDFVSLTQGIDTTTAVGRMLYGQLAVFAEFEREQIRERTKAGMKAAQARGVHVGRPKKLSDRQVIEAALDLKVFSVRDVATRLGVSPAILRRALSNSSSQPGDHRT